MLAADPFVGGNDILVAVAVARPRVADLLNRLLQLGLGRPGLSV